MMIPKINEIKHLKTKDLLDIYEHTVIYLDNADFEEMKTKYSLYIHVRKEIVERIGDL